mmetsp:Transcript_17474/g.19748  ORF Transcript_17474/g.19748 Transcript_17474/m.19748 type:complete len:80 (+) Transcript_17474:1124-1363(+)
MTRWRIKMRVYTLESVKFRSRNSGEFVGQIKYEGMNESVVNQRTEKEGKIFRFTRYKVTGKCVDDCQVLDFCSSKRKMG